MKKLEIRPIRDAVIEDVKSQVARFAERYGFPPHLAIILVGDNKASQSYIRTKEKLAAEVGMTTENHFLPSAAGKDEIIALIDSLNADDSVHGILLQLPLPDGFDVYPIMERILPEKDPDALTSSNMGCLFKDRANVLACTPKGIMKIFDFCKIPLASKNVLIINRSDIVGKPLAAALLSKGVDATVTVAHSKTSDVKRLAESADIIVVAVSKYGYIDKTWKLKDGVVIIDVSINRIPDSSSEKGYKVVGDFLPEDFEDKPGSYTPVPGGVGLMTVCELLDNTMFLAWKQMEKRG